MENIYEFNIDPRNVFVVGDNHGNWGMFKYKIKESNIRDSVIIVAGDCGIGFEKKEYYKHVLNSFKKVLSDYNNILIFIRGNHDDPSYFDGVNINYKRFKAIPDYSILSFNGHNVLCVGGAISIDRKDRINDDHEGWMYHKSSKKTYWFDEIPVYKPEILEKIKSSGIIINTVVTHSAPSFAPLTDKDNIEKYIKQDSSLTKDIENERLTLTKLYDHLVKQDKHPIKTWIYGHFHQHKVSFSEEDIKFVMLDRFRPAQAVWDIYPITY